MDGIFYWTGKGLNWDAYGHNPTSGDPSATAATARRTRTATTPSAPTAINYFEWCQDHNKPLQAAPFGDVGGGGPVTLPDPNIFTNGAWYGGSPYLGPEATVRDGQDRHRARLRPRAPSRTRPAAKQALRLCGTPTTSARSPPTISFPGGMMMMMLVDSREFVIDESN